MKKHLALLLALLLTGSQSGWAELLGLAENLKADASFEIIGNQAKNEEDFADATNDRRGGTVSRIRIGINGDLTDQVSSRVEFLRNSDSGAQVQFGDGGDSVGGEFDNLMVMNAYVDIKDFLNLDSVRLGRQYLGRPGDLLLFIGPYQDDSLSVSALDGLSVTKKFGRFNFWAATGKVNEDDGIVDTDAGDGAGAGDVNVSWLIVNTSELFPDITVPLEVGYYFGKDMNQSDITPPVNDADDNNTLTIIDLRAGYTLDMGGNPLKLGAQYAMNGGEAGTGTPGAEVSYGGNAMLLSAAYDNTDSGFGLHLRYANASGDDTADQDDDSFRDFSAVNAGASDFRWGEILSNSNTFAAATGMTGPGLDTGAQGPGLNIINIGGYYVIPKWDNKITVSLDYIMAKMNEVAPGADDGIGDEIDLAFNYNYSNDIKMAAGYAMLSPDEGLTGGPGASDDAVTKFFAKFMMKFGEGPGYVPQIEQTMATPKPAARRGRSRRR